MQLHVAVGGGAQLWLLLFEATLVLTVIHYADTLNKASIVLRFRETNSKRSC